MADICIETHKNRKKKRQVSYLAFIVIAIRNVVKEKSLHHFNVRKQGELLLIVYICILFNVNPNKND